jgi:formylglycine-generating enzyme required for sulfatase activity
MRSVALCLLACLLLCWPPAAGRADDTPAELAKKARAVLHKHCYRCHGDNGRAVAGVYVLNRQRLIDRKKLVPGNPGKSRLFQAILDEEMPPADADVKVRPSKDDVEVLRRWIAASAPDFAPAVAARTFLTDADVLSIIHDDLKARGGRDRRFTRYFTLTHLYNAGISDDELQSYRHGLSKLINSLSWGRQIVRPTPIDRARTIFRIDLRDYEWDARTWQAILSRYPYGLTRTTTAHKYIQAASGTALPYVRGDWFVFAASRPPLYHSVLGIPAADTELEKRLEIDVSANIRRDRVARAGFNGSGVSRNNRLIERHVSRYGAYWKSYDFAGNDGQRNLFRHPLGPAGQETFVADGGEIIFSLPNGLQGYMLVDARGKRLDEAPVKIVSTGNRLKPEVLNGISCMDCHARGMIFKDDQVRKSVESSDSFSDEEKDTVRALYPLKADFDKLLKEDASRFRRAVEQSGDSVQKTDTVVLLAARFEEELDLKLAAAEAGLKAEELLRGLKRSARLGRALAPLHAGGTVKRDTFVEAFGDIVRTLELGTLVQRGSVIAFSAPGRAITNSIGMKLVLIPAGKFTMGSPASEKDRDKEDEAQHEVEITRPFYLGICEVTQKQFRQVMGYNPSYFSRGGRGKPGVKYSDEPGGGKERVKDLGSTDDLPVENVSWEEARMFLEKLSALAEEQKEGRKYRLPTEAEWEYACRGPTAREQAFHFGQSLSSAEANFDGRYPYGDGELGNWLERTCKVGSYRSNGFGLFDMHGNVSEWCSDWYASPTAGKGPRKDPQGPSDGSRRVLRGGGWADFGKSCRSAFRRGDAPDSRSSSVGFRVVLVPVNHRSGR